MLWREEAVCQVKVMLNFGPNVVSFLLTSGARIWYVVGSYMLMKDVPAVHQLGQDLAAKPKGIETIFMVELNARLKEPYDNHEEDMTTSLADYGLEEFTRNFTPWRWCRIRGSWTWHMQRGGWQITGRG